MNDALALPNCAKGSGTATANLRVRSAPDVRAGIVGMLAAGDAVTIWARDGEWAIVQRADGLTGWAHTAYLTLSALTA